MPSPEADVMEAGKAALPPEVQAQLERRRAGRGLWLMSWFVLSAPQGAILGQLVAATTAGSTDVYLLTALVLGAAGLQVLKAWASVPRLLDLGRAPDDFLWGVVPFLNVALFFQLWARTPGEALRVRRVRSWATQTGALAAWARALRSAPSMITVGLPTVVLAALVQGDGGKRFVDAVFARAEGELGEGLAEGLWLVLAVLALFTLVQLPRRATARRASWWPALLLLPTLLLTLAVVYRDSTTGGAGPILLYLVSSAWELGPVAWVGGVCAALWIASARLAQAGAPAGLGAAWSKARGTLPDVVAVWSGRQQVVQLGAEVIIPGIWFSVSWAFSDWIAASGRDQAAFGGSVRAVTGARGRVFKVMLIGFLMAQASMLGAIFGMLGTERGVGALFDPSLVPEGVATLAMLGPWAALWIGTVALGILYDERTQLLAAREAQVAQQAAEGALLPGAPTE